MKAYLMTTLVIFGLITIAHLARVLAEGTHLVRDPWYIALTLAAAALCVWAALLLRRLSERRA
jgi:predicted Co/Zn/Cd cation transporter (cation efflux family)